jgi:flagellar biosynthetic protein FliQ
MAPETVVTLVKQTLEMVMILSAPLLIAALGTGLLISIFQAATQINESTITFVPKLVVIFIVIVLAGPWIIRLMVDFTKNLLMSIPTIIN